MAYGGGFITKWAPPRNSEEIPQLNTTRFSPTMEMSRLARDGTAEPVSRDQILRRERTRTEGNIIFFCSTDHVQGWHTFATCVTNMKAFSATIPCNMLFYFNTHAISFNQRYVSIFYYITSPSGQLYFLHDTFELSVLFEIKEE